MRNSARASVHMIMGSRHWERCDGSRVNTHALDTRVVKLVESLQCALDREWSADELATMVGVSTSQLRRIFRNQTGCSPMCYLRNTRLVAAAKLLESSDLSVARVARTVGFRDLSHFVRAFHQYSGESPSSWRNSREPIANARFGHLAREATSVGK